MSSEVLEQPVSEKSIDSNQDKPVIVKKGRGRPKGSYKNKPVNIPKSHFDSVVANKLNGTGEKAVDSGNLKDIVISQQLEINKLRDRLYYVEASFKNLVEVSRGVSQSHQRFLFEPNNK